MSNTTTPQDAQPRAQVTITSAPEFGDDYPDIPAEATAWERQEINSLWRSVLRSSSVALNMLVDVYSDPLNGTSAVAASHYAAKAAIAAEGLQRSIDAVHHRLSISGNDNAPGDVPDYVRVAIEVMGEREAARSGLIPPPEHLQEIITDPGKFEGQRAAVRMAYEAFTEGDLYDDYDVDGVEVIEVELPSGHHVFLVEDDQGNVSEVENPKAP